MDIELVIHNLSRVPSCMLMEDSNIRSWYMETETTSLGPAVAVGAAQVVLAFGLMAAGHGVVACTTHATAIVAARPRVIGTYKVGNTTASFIII